MRHIILSITAFCCLFSQQVFSQGGLKFGFNAGVSMPMGTFKNTYNFANRGFNFNSDVDYFFGNIGFGLSGGIINNNVKSPFLDMMSSRFNYREYVMTYDNWFSKYILLGPVVNFEKGKFGLMGRLKIGFLDIDMPDVFVNATFFNQHFPAIHYSGNTDGLMGVWKSGMSGYYRFSKNMSFQLSGDLLTTKFFSGISNTMDYRDVSDSNNNGFIDGTEYFAASDHSISNDVIYSNLLISAGILINVSSESPQEIEERKMSEAYLPQDSIMMVDAIELEEMIDVDTSQVTEKEIVYIERPSIRIDTVLVIESMNKETADLIFNAGKLYLENNDYPNALKCFQSVNQNSEYPISWYYESLTLLKLGRCQEGLKKYNDFSYQYPKENKPSLAELFQIVMKSCKQIQVIEHPQNTESNQELQDEAIIATETEVTESKKDVAENNIPEKVTEQEKPIISEAKIIEDSNDSELEVIVHENEEKQDIVEQAMEKELPKAVTKEELAIDESTIKKDEEMIVQAKEDNQPQIKEIDSVSTEIATENEKTKIETKTAKVETEFPSSKPVEVTYMVQFLAAKEGNLNLKKAKSIAPIQKEYFSDMKMYRYMFGSYSDLEDAKSVLMKIRKAGYKDAFIAIYHEGKRVVTFYHPE
ncbi:MAG TPA: hypothetical protein P5235_08925 [Saprospiraceae bacterium]|nr:hypothetical protein [Lewinellaceae bacterium]HRX29498.1 hypothetical protein [Saprospiraceae bacterium]